jgi:hypothetical protein
MNNKEGGVDIYGTPLRDKGLNSFRSIDYSPKKEALINRKEVVNIFRNGKS